ncbi:hypothetical protein FH609_011720 [Streptomyces sp. 3MP-14]|uniref:Phage tail tape measure protein domain-containing protein n=1 Tax=Streptomyces mimosae TaxID=2586635 RepID=A0A5N6AG75_9ACTN|nr:MULTISPECIES: phage tail tape measure protein [Streptomyces]KAB8167063.1 hypothetical protein FH607_009170 [Streptomyces mimosae]KAB8177004.1 hypothetical protein FH609_011720 [Streptomyces sp. 3MP-14]
MALLDELLVAIGVDASGLTSGARGAADDVERSLGGIAAAGAGAVVAGGFVMGMQSAMDITSVTSRLEDQLDLTSGEAQRAGDVAGAVYADGFGASLADVGDSVGAVISSVEDMGEATDAELIGMTRSAEALAARFEFDVAESATAAGALMKNGMAGDGAEAFDLIAAAAQQVPASMRQEIPELTTEYGEFFAQLGATGPQMMGLLAASAENPLFQLDKLGDAVKEFTLRVADTEAVAEPLERLGLNVGEIQELVNTGQGTQAFDQIVTALADVDDQTDRTMLAFELMGGPGEDAQATLTALGEAGGFAGTELGDVAGAASDMAASMEADPAQQMDAAVRTLQMTLGTALLPVLSAASGFFAQNQGLISAIAPAVLILAAAIAAWVAIQWLLNFALTANPIGLVVVAIGLLVAAIVYIATQTTIFQTIWQAMCDGVIAAWNWCVDLVKAGFEIAKTIFLNWPGPGLLIKHFDTIRSAVRNVINFFKTAWQGGIDAVTNIFGGLRDLPGRAEDWFDGLGDRIGGALSGGFKSGINSIISGWNGLSFTLPKVDLGPLGSIGGGTLHTPNVPYLAAGGVTTGPTLAMIGEGPEDEAVLPLSRLDGMLRSVADPVRRAGDGRAEQRVVLELDFAGGDDDLVRLFRRAVRVRGGSVQTVLGG